jgi:hypothetical protein
LFSSKKCPDQLWDPGSLLFNTYLGSFSASKKPRHISNNSPPTRDQVKYDLTGTFFPLMPSWHALGQLYPIPHQEGSNREKER